MALTAYQTQTQRLLHDPNAQAYSLTDITAYINIARSQIALEGQCVRALLSAGAITGFTITNPGSGYSGAASVAIVGSGSQAFASATIGGGAVATCTLNTGYPGWGYGLAGSTTTVTVTGSLGGSNAVITPTIDTSVATVTGQEVYYFSAWNNLASNQSVNPGVNQILGVLNIAVSQSGTYKPMLTPMVWSEFQAYLRIYQNTQQNYPVYWSQYSFGVNGAIYLYPWPSQQLMMDVDTYCQPINLVTDLTAEALPYPWTDAVPYYAAYLAYENSSRKEDADRMFKMYQMFMRRARSFSESLFVPDYYSGDD